MTMKSEELDLRIDWAHDLVALSLHQRGRDPSTLIGSPWRELDRVLFDGPITDKAERLMERWSTESRGRPSRLSVDLLQRYEHTVARGLAIARLRATFMSPPPLVVHRFVREAARGRNSERLALTSLDRLGDTLAELSTVRERPALIVVHAPALTEQRSPDAVTIDELGLSTPLSTFLTLAAQAFARLGCGAVVFTADLDAVQNAILRDVPLDELARGRNVFVALSDGAERIVSPRDAVLDAARDGISTSQRARPSARELARQPLRTPETELETLLRERASRWQSELRSVVEELETATTPIDVKQLITTSERVTALLQPGDPARAWALSRRVERQPDFGETDPDAMPAAMPARTIGAELSDAAGPVRSGLVAGRSYDLVVSIRLASTDAIRLGGEQWLSLDELAHMFVEDVLPLELCVFTRPDEFEPPPSRLPWRLPRVGVPNPIVIPIVPVHGEATRRRIRVALYHRTRMIQSMSIDVSVADEPQTARQAEPPVVDRDWLASDELVTVDRGEVPALGIWLNDGPNGTHRMGVIGTGDDEPPLTLDLGDVKTLASNLRTALAELPGADLNRAQVRDLIAGGIVKLATAGRQAFDAIPGTLPEDRAAWNRFRWKLGSQALIEIARCTPSAPALPWQLLYDLPLATTSADRRTCEVFAERMARASQQAPESAPACSSDPRCVHRAAIAGEEVEVDITSLAARVVCPYGFWGMRHRIAQPFGAPPRSRVQTSEGRSALQVLASYYEFPNANDHVGELSKIAAGRLWSNPQLVPLVKKLRSDFAILYFFCHGRVDATTKTLVLQIGSPKLPQEPIDHSILSQSAPEAGWLHSPVVILNGCDTLRVLPDEVSLFLGTLRSLGAGAVVGTEIVMTTLAAAKIGTLLVGGIIEGRPLEHVVLEMRRRLVADFDLRGLAYNVHGPAGFVCATPGA